AGLLSVDDVNSGAEVAHPVRASPEMSIAAVETIKFRRLGMVGWVMVLSFMKCRVGTVPERERERSGTDRPTKTRRKLPCRPHLDRIPGTGNIPAQPTGRSCERSRDATTAHCHAHELPRIAVHA